MVQPTAPRPCPLAGRCKSNASYWLTVSCCPAFQWSCPVILWPGCSSYQWCFPSPSTPVSQQPPSSCCMQPANPLLCFVLCRSPSLNPCCCPQGSPALPCSCLLLCLVLCRLHVSRQLLFIVVVPLAVVLLHHVAHGLQSGFRVQGWRFRVRVARQCMAYMTPNECSTACSFHGAGCATSTAVPPFLAAAVHKTLAP